MKPPAGGQASLAISLLASGKRSLRAYYSGSAGFSASTSPVLSQTVNAVSAYGFQAPVNYAAGPGQNSMAIGDFNGDGKPDLAVANRNTNSVTVLLGNGDGTFRTGATYTAAFGPVSIAVGDFNGDGIPDLVIACADTRNMTVLLGNGDGTFRLGGNYVSSSSASIAVGDFNGDGKADLVIPNAIDSVSVLLGNGDGTFQTAVNYAAGDGPYSVAVGDFNGDGKADLAVTNRYGNNLSVLLGNGDGTFRAAVNYATGIFPFSVAVGDFNGDGKSDLAVTNLTSNNVSVFLGNGDGTFQAAVSYAANSGPESVVVADFNGDDKADLMVLNYDGTVSVLLGNGDGTFQSTVNYAVGGVDTDSFAIADFNGDGRADLAVTRPGTLSVQLGGNAITTTTLTSSSNPASYGQPVALTATVSPALGAGSVTFYDGTTILETKPLAGGQASMTTGLLASGTRALRAYYSGSGSYGTSASAVLGQKVVVAAGKGFLPGLNFAAAVFGGGPQSIALGDFNGDGKADVAVANGYGVGILLGNGDGSLRPEVTYSAGGTTCFVAVGDFNGDGKADVAVANLGSNNISILLGNGDGTFRTAVNYPVPNQPRSIAVGDFNGDGKADLAVANYSGTVSVFLGNGDGSFRSAVNYAAGTAVFSLAAGDFNGDGVTDLVVADYDSGALVLLGNGDGTFQPPVNYPAGSGPWAVVVGDFNGDGDADLAVADLQGGVSVLLGNGNGTFQPAVNYAAGKLPQGVTIGDFNGDGKADLVVANFNSNTVSVLLGNGDGTFQPAVNYAAGSAPVAVAVADFNGDSRADIAIAGYGGDDVRILLGGPAAVIATTVTSSPNPATYGQAVTLTATVSPAQPAGSVTFYAGTTVLGNTPLVNGQAALTTSMLASGTSLLKAYYYGGSVYGTSTSPLLAQIVNPVPANAFRMPASYPTGTGPYSIAVGDFNGDGKADLVVANLSSNTVSVLLGKSDGTFQTPVNYSVVSSGPTSVAVGDFNGDGKADLAVANVYGVNVSVLLGNGDGTFQRAVTYAADNQPDFIVVADFNGDGKADLAVVNGISYDVSILLGNGDGTFQPAMNSYLALHTLSFAVGDFNSDGNADIAFVDSSGSVKMLLGAGDGTFVQSGNVAGFSMASVATADFNGDGQADLIAVSWSATAAANANVLLGNGDGTFRKSAIALPTGAKPDQIAVGDFNGDGKADFAVADEDGNVNLFLGNGDGTFQPVITYAAGSGVSSYAGIAAGDFNGDGRADLAVAGVNVEVLLGDTATQLKFTTPAVNTTLVLASVAVQVQDNGGMGVQSPNASVTLTSTPAGVSQTAPVTGGVASFSNVAFPAPGTYTLTATSNGLASVTSDSFLVTGSPSKLVFTTQPSNGVAGAAIPVIFVQVQDTWGNVVTLSSASVTVSSNPAGVGSTVNAANGVAAFSNLIFNTPGTYTLTVTSPGLASATSNPFVVVPTYTVSGQIMLNGGGFSGVTISLSGSQTTSRITGGSGNYSFVGLPAGGTYTITPTLAGYVFIPPSQTFTNLGANQAANFTATTAGSATVSGQVTVSGLGLSEVAINVNGSQSASTTTDSSGNYAVVLAKGGTYTVAAARSGYSFGAPVAISELIANQTASFTGVAGVEFYPVTPCRVADTRPGAGFTGSSGPPFMGAGTTRAFPVSSSSCGIPATAAAYSLNVTVVPRGYLGYLSIWPTGQALPNVSTLNSYSGTVVANAAIVPAGSGGAISIYVTDATDVLFDINGYFAPPAASGLQFYPVTPCRVADTRSGAGKTGAFGPPSMAAGSQRTFPIPAGSCGIPTTAAAYSLNFTAVPKGPLGLLTTWPAGQAQPNVSTLNSYTGTVVANAAIVPAGANGAIAVYTSDATDVLFDINGYFAPPSGAGLQFYPVTPCRVADTRSGAGFSGPFGPPIMPAGTQRSFPVPSGSCGVPTGAGAYSLNFTAVPEAPQLGIFTTWPTGLSTPLVSTMNSYNGSVVANAAIVPAGSGGAISIWVTDAADVLFDINGYFAP